MAGWGVSLAGNDRISWNLELLERLKRETDYSEMEVSENVEFSPKSQGTRD